MLGVLGSTSGNNFYMGTEWIKTRNLIFYSHLQIKGPTISADPSRSLSRSLDRRLDSPHVVQVKVHAFFLISQEIQTFKFYFRTQQGHTKYTKISPYENFALYGKGNDLYPVCSKLGYYACSYTVARLNPRHHSQLCSGDHEGYEAGLYHIIMISDNSFFCLVWRSHEKKRFCEQYGKINSKIYILAACSLCSIWQCIHVSTPIYM